MEEAIEDNGDWFEGLGYGDADLDLKGWMLWHRQEDERTKEDYY
jgi:hypothetical protein